MIKAVIAMILISITTQIMIGDKDLGNYVNTKVVVGNRHGPTFYPNTALFQSGSRIKSISMSIDEVIDRIDWNITDENHKEQNFRMGYEIK